MDRCASVDLSANYYVNHAQLQFEDGGTLVGEQGPDLRYLRRAIWKGRDFLDSMIWIQILDVVMNNFGTS